MGRRPRHGEERQFRLASLLKRQRFVSSTTVSIGTGLVPSRSRESSGGERQTARHPTFSLSDDPTHQNSKLWPGKGISTVEFGQDPRLGRLVLLHVDQGSARRLAVLLPVEKQDLVAWPEKPLIVSGPSP